MKEATGELSVTVIAIVAIAAILAVFTVFLLPTLKVQIALTQACSQGAGSTVRGDKYTIVCGVQGNMNAPTLDGTGQSAGTKKGSKTCGESDNAFVCSYFVEENE